MEQWNCCPRKDNIIPFLLNENRFSFFVADYLLVGQLCTNPKSDKSLVSCLKVTQYSTSKIEDVPLYNSCSLPIQVMTTRTIAGLPRITGTCPGWWKQSFRLRSWSLVRFQVRATSCHLTSLKSAWKSTPKCTWMCWRMWWSPGIIRWPVADPGCGIRTRRWPTSPKRPRLGFRRSATTLYSSLSSPPPQHLNPLDNFVWSYVENITNMTSHNTKASLIAAIRQVFDLWKRHASSSGSVLRWWLRLKAATLNWCQLYYIIKLPELIFSIKFLK